MTAAFKEWALICEALGGGRQSVIVRKGGIAEGREGFSFRNREFLLFPTWFHEQLANTKLPPETPVPAQLEDEIEIAYAATVEQTAVLTDLEHARRLDISELARAGPGLAVRIAQLDPGELALVGEAHVDAHLNVAELRHGARRQGEVRRHAASLAEPDLRRRIVLVRPGVPLAGACDPHLRRMEIGPARTRLAAQRAIAFVNELGAVVGFGAEAAA